LRGVETALYDICVDALCQRRGVGRRLVQALADSCRQSGRIAIVLRCPESQPANDFYACLGFQQVAIEPGRRRRLIVWRLALVEA
jgi:ribosomal protein S18 acetylase RimI-like enzyme